MKFEFAEECIKAFSKTSGETVCFSGGEPLLYKKLPALIGSVKSLGLRAQITTNGTLLHSLPLELIKKLDVIHISLNSLRDETHKVIAGASKKYGLDFILRNIDRLVKENVYFKINCVYLKKYPEEISSVIKFCLDQAIPVRLMNDMLDDADYHREYLRFTEKFAGNDLIKYRTTTNPGFEACKNCDLRINCASTRAVWCFPDMTVTPCPYQKNIVEQSADIASQVTISYNYISS
jgi:molybdenum cofactor biosynthesis enzyme MoaA